MKNRFWGLSIFFWRIGQNAGWKKRVVVQWVILQADNLMPDISRLFQVAIFAAQPKHSRALLGSNPERNRLCDMTASLWPHPSFRVRPCRCDMLDCPPMPRKTH